MSTESRQIRCSSCGYAAPGNVAWAFRNLCPRCLAPLPFIAEAEVVGASPPSAEDLQEVISAWVGAFNARDLGGMLARMSPRIEFHPIRLGGVDGGYRGHGGVKAWFKQVMEDEHQHSLEVSEFRKAGVRRSIALGSLRLDGDRGSVPFWALDRFSNGLIVATHHYLANADIPETGPPSLSEK